MELQTAVERFGTWLRLKGNRPTTVATHLGRLERFVADSGVGLVGELTAEVVERWLVAQLDQTAVYQHHPHRPSQQRPLAASTIKQRWLSLKYFCRFCREKGWLDADPFAGVPVPNFRARRGTADKMMRPETLKAMLQRARQSARDYALLAFVADTGCRVGEVANLSLGDLDVAAGTAVVRGKTKPRTVTFSQAAGEALATWLKERPLLAVDRVFVSGREPMTTNGIRLLLKRLGKGLPGPTNPHALRHLVGQRWTDELNAEQARAKLGHANVTTTLGFYYRSDQAAQVAATERLSLLTGGEGDATV